MAANEALFHALAVEASKNKNEKEAQRLTAIACRYGREHKRMKAARTTVAQKTVGTIAKKQPKRYKQAVPTVPLSAVPLSAVQLGVQRRRARD